MENHAHKKTNETKTRPLKNGKKSYRRMRKRPQTVGRLMQDRRQIKAIWQSKRKEIKVSKAMRGVKNNRKTR